MKHINFTLLLAMLMSMAGTKVWAQTPYGFEIDGIYYAFDSWCMQAFVVGGDYNIGSGYNSGNVVIPPEVEYYNGEFCGVYSVTRIEDNAFSNCDGLTSVTIPESVTQIGEYNQEIKGKTNVEIIPVSA